MGAQWIHGEVGNVAYKLANDNSLVDASLTEEDFDEKFAFEKQGEIEEKIGEKLEALAEEIGEMEEEQMHNDDLSYGQFFDQKFKKVSAK